MRSIPQLCYAAIRRLGCLDITGLLYGASTTDGKTSCPAGYEIRAVSIDELADLVRAGRAPTSLAASTVGECANRAVIVAFWQDCVVSFLWLAQDQIPAAENFSRAAHLGTSIQLPDGMGFIYNAWTDPQHRGKRLIASMLHWGAEHHVMATRSWLTMTDWTNAASRRAFEHLGMKPVGWIYRLGRGSWQLSLLPKSAGKLGLQLAQDAPGLRISY